jgi:crotonobetainyl-CoA:carnitine CoA-transferase CaiB-like acyl-CoA transferase
MNHQSASLEGIRVLELASVLAGPLAGTDLALRGATVTKVERPPHGDVTRSWRPSTEPPVKDADGNPTSAYWMAANQGKHLAWVDLGTAEGLNWLESELSNTDVLIQNFKSADLAKFNLQSESVAKRHPQLIHVRLVGFRHQPDRIAYDVVVQAETGWMHMNGDTPTRMPVALMDVLASHSIREAALEGLFARARHPENGGSFHEVALDECGVAALANQATNHLIGGLSPAFAGNEHPNIAPYGDLLRCRDGHVVLAVGSDRQFQALCGLLEVAELATEEAFINNSNRLENRKELMERLAMAAGHWRKANLIQACIERGVPAGAVKSLPEVFSNRTNPWS